MSVTTMASVMNVITDIAIFLLPLPSLLSLHLNRKDQYMFWRKTSLLDETARLVER